MELLADDEKVKRELSAKTGRSARTAVMVLRGEDKAEARRFFQTPLLFSIQEAKGLEYENIILCNFMSGSPRPFDEIVRGVTPDALEGDLQYARARDKSDKSLDAYKFYVNALYVAITRAVANLFILEQNPTHRLLGLLGLVPRKDGVRMAEQRSSDEEWQAEARRLELQGKGEQAEAIRKSILAIQDVPWEVLTPAGLERLMREALDPAQYNKQAKQLLFEYAALHNVPYLLERLVALRFNRARNAVAELPAVERKYHQDYTGKNFEELSRKIARYGVDFRNPLNQTPLMIAARLGLAALVRTLMAQGANPHLMDNWGRTPLQIALRQAYLDLHYARSSIGEVYPALAPSSISVRIDRQLMKLDNHRPEFFLLNSMLAVAQDILRVKIHYAIPAFQTGDFVDALAHFPDRVIPPWRKARQYITSVLARNELFRQDPYNRRLFVRVHRGYYILNPRMEVEVTGTWVNVYDLMQIEHLEKERDNPEIQRFVQYVRRLQQALTPAPAAGATADLEMAASTSGPPPPEPLRVAEAALKTGHEASNDVSSEGRPVAPDASPAPSPRKPESPEQLGLFPDEPPQT